MRDVAARLATLERAYWNRREYSAFEKFIDRVLARGMERMTVAQKRLAGEPFPEDTVPVYVEFDPWLCKAVEQARIRD